MAQKLFVKKGGVVREIMVLRSWADINGQEVYLHADGRYARKDGAPLKSESDLAIIGDRLQREQALRWWRNTGAAESRVHYERIENEQREREGDFRIAKDDHTVLDAVLYTRRGAGKKKGAAVSAPKAWMEWFTQRPDWWGQATRIEFMDYIYDREEPADEPETQPAQDSTDAQPAVAAPY